MVPKLWTETIETHRSQVREAILHVTARLVSEQGPTSVTMSQVADGAGIGRATLYKYFSDVAAILTAWHADQIAVHMGQLTAVANLTTDPGSQLNALLRAYADICAHRGSHSNELNAMLHQGDKVAEARRDLIRLFRDVIERAARAGLIRDDVTAQELAVYCVHALTAANTLNSKAATRRLVEVILAGLHSADH